MSVHNTNPATRLLKHAFPGAHCFLVSALRWRWQQSPF